MWTLLLLQIHTVPHGAISNCHSEQELQACTPVVSLLHANWTSANIHSVCWPTASSDVQQGARAANIQAVWGDCLLNILDLHAMHRDQCVPIHLSMHTVFMDQIKEFPQCQIILAAIPVPDAACTCGERVHCGYRRFNTSLQIKVPQLLCLYCVFRKSRYPHWWLSVMFYA